MVDHRSVKKLRSSSELPTTHWTNVEAAGKIDEKTAREAALAALYAAYWKPVYAFIRGMGRSHDEALDLTQGYFTTRIVEKNDVAAADKERGRFRSWLLTGVKHYMANDLARARAKKRYPGEPLLSIDATEGEDCCPIQPGHDVTPEQLYERCWATTVLERALNRLRDSYVQRGRAQLFEKLHPLLVGGDTERRRAVARELGMSDDTLDTNLSRLRGRLNKAVRAEVEALVDGEEKVEEELRYLCAVLQAR